MISNNKVRIAISIPKDTLEILDAVVKEINAKNISGKRQTRSDILVLSFISIMYQNYLKEEKGCN